VSQSLHTSVVHNHAKVRRTTRSSWIGFGVLALIVIVAPIAPYVISRGAQGSLVTLFSLITMATMWNLLAGYGGMLSVGQQAYIGIGAYALVYVSDKIGLDPFMAVPIAVVVAGLISIPISYLAFRLQGGYFAIGTWVIAEVIMLIVMQIPALGGGIGLTFHGFSGLTAGRRIGYVYWLSLAGVIIAVLVTYLIMRSRLGLGFTAIRDDATAAGSLGVRVTSSKRFVFVVAAMGCGLAGAMITASTLRVQPDAAFSLNYSVFMIFIVVIGGLGTIEGPILGAIVFFALQQWLSGLGVWYLVILGLVAIVVTLFLPRGLWGLISGNGRFRLFPVGYHVTPPAHLFGIDAHPSDDSAPGGDSDTPEPAPA
jgi:branched-chain amino acid transport system permease protein